MDDMIYWERFTAMGGDGYDYDEGLTVNPASLIKITYRIMRSGVIGMMWT